MTEHKGANDAKPSGPYLATAAIAERILTEQDGVVSLVRIVDHFTFQPPQALVESDEEWRGRIDASALVSFKAGGFTGPAMVRFEPVFPDGQRKPGVEVPIEFPDPYGGANLVIKLDLVTRTTGIYWYDLFLDGELVTRMPFRITIEPQGEDDEFAETQGTTA